MLSGNMFAYIEILRPANGLMAVLGFLIGLLVAGAPIIAGNAIAVATAAAALFLVSGAGMILNDYFDYDIDKLNKPERPIPSGRISKKAAWNYSLLLYIYAVALAIALAVALASIYIPALVLFNSFVSAVYAWKIKKTPFGHFAVSWLVASVFVFAALLAGSNAIIILLFAVSFFANTAREIAKAIEDIEGDKIYGVRTLAVLTGKTFSAWVAIMFTFFAIITSFFPYTLLLFPISYLAVVCVANVLFAASCFLIFFDPAKSQKMMKIAMFIALIAFLTVALQVST